jgi:hypothetical protein
MNDDPHDEGVRETLAVLLATFALGRDPAVVPPVEPRTQKTLWESHRATDRDRLPWSMALGGVSIEDAVELLKLKKLLEKREMQAFVPLVGIQPPKKEVYVLTPEGLVSANDFVEKLAQNGWQTKSSLKPAGIKRALAAITGIGAMNFVVQSAVSGLIGGRFDAGFMKLYENIKRVLQGAPKTTEGETEEFEHMLRIPLPQQPKPHETQPSGPVAPSATVTSAGFFDPVMALLMSVALIAARFVAWLRRPRRQQ